jgi:hypothetical protein
VFPAASASALAVLHEDLIIHQTETREGAPPCRPQTLLARADEVIE